VPRIGRLVLAGAAAAAMAAGMAVPGVAGATTSATGRVYELVTPVDKNGGEIAADSHRTRAATDGDALDYIALPAFGDVIGSSVATDYVAVRSTDPNPGNSGWTTHAITPKIDTSSLDRIAAGLQPLYVGEFSPDLEHGVFYSTSSPLTGDSNVAAVENLYRRNDLLTPGPGSYSLITGCPLCSSNTPLVASSDIGALTPELAGVTPTLDKALFESERQLTADAPGGAGDTHLYVWDGSGVQLAGRIPQAPATACDDAGSPACVAAEVSIAGQGAGNLNGPLPPALTPHTISDGSDGHTRVFFSEPTDATGTTVNPGGRSGNVYMRVDGHQTLQLNVDEASAATTFAPATFLDATPDGSRAFFSTTQQLTDDAPASGSKLYMYDATKPPSQHLTYVKVDNNTDDFGTLIGTSADGHYVYMVVGTPTENNGVFLWHDGVATLIGVIPSGQTDQGELASSGQSEGVIERRARVTPDGRHLLFSAYSGAGLTHYNQGACGGSFGCREFYVYSADSGTLACVSCNPSGRVATAAADIVARAVVGGAETNSHLNTAITDDGSSVFFNTAQALVPQDVNGVTDAYEYDVATRQVHLLSTGTSAYDSFFLDASADGRDAFIFTRDQLSAWDGDGAYDIYDARIGGGFPDPPAAAIACVPGGAPSAPDCQPPPSIAPSIAGSATTTFTGGDNASGVLHARRTAPRGCRRGYVRKRVRGRVKCVKQKAKKKAKKATKAKRARRATKRSAS